MDWFAEQHFHFLKTTTCVLFQIKIAGTKESETIAELPRNTTYPKDNQGKTRLRKTDHCAMRHKTAGWLQIQDSAKKWHV